MATTTVIEAMTNEDIEYIEEVAGFYGITMDEAYKRVVDGNVDGVVLLHPEQDDELDMEM